MLEIQRVIKRALTGMFLASLLISVNAQSSTSFTIEGRVPALFKIITDFSATETIDLRVLASDLSPRVIQRFR